MFRGSVKSTGYPPHSPVSPSLPLPCVTVCHHIWTVLYRTAHNWRHQSFSLLNKCSAKIGLVNYLIIYSVAKNFTLQWHVIRLLRKNNTNFKNEKGNSSSVYRQTTWGTEGIPLLDTYESPNWTPQSITVFARVICALFFHFGRWKIGVLNPLNAELNPIYHLLVLLGGATIVVVSRLRVKICGFYLWRSWSGFYSSITENTVRFVNTLL